MQANPHKPSAITLALAAVLAQSCLSPAAHAQAAEAPSGAASAAETSSRKDAKSGQLQTVIVTAERRSQNIQKAALSVVAVDGLEIAEQGLVTAADILKNVTGVEIQGAARGSVIAMRGIGSDLPPGMGESAVSTNFDGIYNFRAEATSIGLFDLDRVEVLRGPQGTLYGRSAAGGAVNFITRGPVIGRSGGNFTLELGSYGLVRGEGGVNLPVNDMLALRVSASSTNRRGYLSDGFDDNVNSAGRVKVLFKPMAGVSLLVGNEQLRLEGKGPGFIPQDNWKNSSTRHQAATGDSVEVGYQRYVQNKTWAQFDADLGFAQLTVLPAWQTARGELYRKNDASRPPGSNEQHNLDPQKATQDTLEVRLSSPERSPLKWVLGYYGYKMNTGTFCFVSCAPDTLVANPSTSGTTSKSVFGQATMPVTQTLRLTAGLRSTRDEKTSGQPGGLAPLQDAWKNTSGKLGLEYDFSANVLGYATYATSYRPGGFNGLPFAVQPVRFEAETLKSMEIGLKSRFLNNTLQVNGALFSLDYKNYQAVDFAPPTYSSISNVPKQKMSGAEMDLRWLLGNAGTLRASLALLDAKLGAYKLVSTGADISGNPMPHAPRTTIKGGYDLPIDLASGAALTLRADVRHVSPQYVSFTENADTLQPRYTTGDVSAVFNSAGDKWTLTAYVKNVNNYVVKTSNFAGYTQVGAPRTVGVILSSKF